MTKKKITTLRLSPEAVAGLEFLFDKLGWVGQRGTSLNAGIEQLGQTASAAMPETIAALQIAVDCAAGIGTWSELVEVSAPAEMEETNALS